ncbi:MAG: MerR family transcriptional regulator [Myxococcaceae bacterium]|nr:MAG: MerR family transcriptional regulator [Myxococcaceae bacterium]
MKDALGRYRINVVAELTGVPAATLRAWERRYGIPTPARTASSYRLYSDVDVVELKRLRDLCSSGMAIAEAAQLVRVDRESRSPSTPPPAGELANATTMALDALLAAVRDFDPERIQQEVSRALFVGSAQEVFERVFAPALRQIGELWHQGQLSVAQEHLASENILGVVGSLVRLVQPSDPRWRVVLASVEDEEHAIGLHGVAIQMAGWGIQSTILGGRTPPQAISDAIEHINPDAIGLSITMGRSPAAEAAMLDAYALACGGRPWFVGGSGAASVALLVRARGGLCLVGSPSDHRVAIERALSRRGPA